MGVGRREAFGVRQLAAALFSCTNNVSVPILALPDRETQKFIPMRNQGEWAWMGIVPTTKHTKHTKTLLG
ncbi:MAG: hypothetical protein GX456_16910 [Verrucomicrobia bacterium]|nr:hypothetical protein [Verrucomicrobiota bacterium]